MVPRLLACLSLVAMPLAGAAQPAAKPRLDAHGFPLPEGAFARLGDLHFAQWGMIAAIAVSPDGKTVATAGALPLDRNRGSNPDRKVMLWNAETGRITREIILPDRRGHSARVERLAFFDRGRLLAIWIDSRPALLMDLQTGREEHCSSTDVSECVKEVALLDNGRIAVCNSLRLTLGRHSFHIVRGWERATGKMLINWTPTKGNIPGLPIQGTPIAASLSPTGQWMAWQVLKPGLEIAREEDYLHEIHVFNTLTGEFKAAVRAFPGRVDSFKLLDEGESVFVCVSWQENKKPVAASLVMDVKTGRERFRLPLHPRIRAIAPDGKSFHVTTAGETGLERVDSATGRVRSKSESAYPVTKENAIALLPDGRAVVADHARWHWTDADLKPLKPRAENPQPLPEVHFVANRLLRARTGADQWIPWWDPGSMLRYWDIEERKMVNSVHGHRPTRDIRPFELSYFCGHLKLLAYHREDGVYIHDTEEGRDRCRLEGIELKPQNRHVAIISHDGRRVFVPRRDGADALVAWFDPQTGHKQGRCRIPVCELFPESYPASQWIRNPAIGWVSDDGAEFGYMTRDSRLALVDCATGNVRLTLGRGVTLDALEPERRHSPTWTFGSAPGRTFLSAYRRSGPHSFELIYYDRKTGAVLRQFEVPDAPFPLGFYPVLTTDHRFLLSHIDFQGGVGIYETATGRYCGQIATHAGRLDIDFRHASIAISPDGKTLAAGGPDSTILLFDFDRPFSTEKELPTPKTAEEADALWPLLGELDRPKAEPAMWALRRAPGPALAMLIARLRPMVPPEASQLQRWIAQLDSNVFAIRGDAVNNLLRVGPTARPSLNSALKQSRSLEQRRRLEEILARLDVPTMISLALRELRALEVLERIGGDEARRLIDAIAEGADGPVVTQEAQRIRDRRPAVPPPAIRKELP